MDILPLAKKQGMSQPAVAVSSTATAALPLGVADAVKGKILRLHVKPSHHEARRVIKTEEHDRSFLLLISNKQLFFDRSKRQGVSIINQFEGYRSWLSKLNWIPGT